MKISKTYSDIFVAALFGLVATALFIYTFLQPVPRAAGREPIGPHAWPMVLLAGIAILSAIVIISNIRKLRGGAEGEQVDELLIDSSGMKLVIAGVIALFIYVIMLSITGFAFTTWVWLAGYIIYLGYRKWTLIIVSTTGITAFLFVLFVGYLNIPLPRGVMIFETFSRMLGH